MIPALDLNDPIAVLLAILKAFADANLDAATYGGLALAAYGTPRETKDADLAVAGLDRAAVRDCLSTAGFDASLAFDRTRFGGNHITRFKLLPGAHQTGLNTVDLVEPRSERFASLVLKRAPEGTLRGQRIRVVTPEDFVVLKVLSTRDRDLEDAASVVLQLAGEISLESVRAEAALLSTEITDHDVLGRLDRALSLVM
jgi:hypothetical protein